jgi:hypothetical protein
MSKWRKVYKVHPAADVFPMMTDAELDRLGEDIKADGLRSQITFYSDGGELFVLDGRNRLEAMERADCGPHPGEPNPSEGDLAGCRKTHYVGDDPVSYVISKNIHRRHLTKQQQADLIVAAVKAGQKPHQLDEVSKGGRGKVNPVKAKAVEIAEKAGISKPTVERSLTKAEGKKPKPVVGDENWQALVKEGRECVKRIREAEVEERELKRKAARQRSKAASKSMMAPSTVDGWRRGYVNACSIGCPDLDAELNLVREAFKEIAGKRAMARAAP